MEQYRGPRAIIANTELNGGGAQARYPRQVAGEQWYKRLIFLD